jgi:F-type H+-transporting ATPase subunit c
LVVSKRSVLTFALVLAAGAFAPVFAQEPAGKFPADMVRWSIITAGFALAFAAGLGALGQGKAISAAAEAIARNPGAAGDIRGALIRPRPHRVAGHLRAADRAHAVLRRSRKANC